MKNLYGVFAGGKFGLTTNRKQAVDAARKNNGTVRAMPYAASKDAGAWDAPTFIALSDQVFPASK